MSQQAYLRDAMERLHMEPEAMALRLGTTRSRFERWLLPSDDPHFLDMDEVVWKFVREIVDREETR